jgi:hypothetical protein
MVLKKLLGDPVGAIRYDHDKPAMREISVVTRKRVLESILLLGAFFSFHR